LVNLLEESCHESLGEVLAEDVAFFTFYLGDFLGLGEADLAFFTCFTLGAAFVLAF